MRRFLSLAAGALLSFSLGAVANAQSQPADVPPGTPTASVTGTVVSSSSTELVLDTTSGRQTFMVDSNSSVPSEIATGDRVTVDFHRLDGNRRHVASVRMSESSGATPQDRDRSLDRDPNAPDTLPATASPLGLLGALGVLSLAGAAALRARRRSL